MASEDDATTLRAMKENSVCLSEIWKRSPDPSRWRGITWVDGKVTELDLSGEDELTELPDEIGNLTSLDDLILTGCSNLIELPETIGGLTSLTRLNLSHCHKLTAVPKSLGNLTFLTILNLSHCINLTEIPECIGELTSLKKLKLSRCKNLKKLPENVGRLASLSELKLSRCDSLIALPDSIGESSSLTQLDLTDCNSLKKLPDKIGNLSSLTQLNLTDCCNITELPEDICELTSLTHIYLTDCKKLTKLPDAISKLSSLEHFGLRYCESLTELPSNMGNLTSLRRLFLDNSTNLKELPVAIGDISSLKQLGLRYCHSLTELPEAIGKLNNLTQLYLTECKNLAYLPGSIGNLTSLEELDLTCCKSLTELPDAITKLDSLDQLYMTGCNKITKLPETIGSLSSLTQLDLRNCTSLTDLPDTIGNLASLKKFKLDNCNNLEQVPLSIGNLEDLQHLTLKGCTKMMFPPQTMHQKDTNTLRQTFHTLDKLLEGGTSIGGLSHDVKQMYFEGCIKLPSFFSSIRHACSKNPALVELKDVDGKTALEMACEKCRIAMKQSSCFLNHYDMDMQLTHLSETTAIIGTTALMDDGKTQRYALKAMSGLEEAISELDSRKNIEKKYIVNVTAVYVDSTVDQDDFDSIREYANRINVEIQYKEGMSKLIEEEIKSRVEKGDEDIVISGIMFPFVLEMELADRTLVDALDYTSITTVDTEVVRKIGIDVAFALNHLHLHDRIHGDLAPSNIMHMVFSWQLIDFDVSCEIGKKFGTKVPSTGYCPPEMAKILLDSTDGGEIEKINPEQYVAQVAYDMWSFGAVLYYLVSGKSLWKTDENGNISLSDLTELSSWSDEIRSRHIIEIKSGDADDDNRQYLCDLISLLLEPDPALREANFFDKSDNEMLMVLKHPFFNLDEDDDATEELQKFRNSLFVKSMMGSGEYNFIQLTSSETRTSSECLISVGTDSDDEEELAVPCCRKKGNKGKEQCILQ